MSGGIDSSACAHLLRSQDLDVGALFVNYGQAAARQELKAAVAMTRYLKMPLQKAVLASPCSFGAGEVRGRNAFLIFTALLLAENRSSILATGIHAGTAYYDCSIGFVRNITTLVAEQTDGQASVIAPFIMWTKKDVHDYFLAADLPIECTYSCEAGTQPPCGKCLSCRDRVALAC